MKHRNTSAGADIQVRGATLTLPQQKEADDNDPDSVMWRQLVRDFLTSPEPVTTEPPMRDMLYAVCTPAPRPDTPIALRGHFNLAGDTEEEREYARNRVTKVIDATNLILANEKEIGRPTDVAMIRLSVNGKSDEQLPGIACELVAIPTNKHIILDVV